MCLGMVNVIERNARIYSQVNMMSIFNHYNGFGSYSRLGNPNRWCCLRNEKLHSKRASERVREIETQE